MIEYIDSVVFLSFPEMASLLKSELKNRFFINNSPSMVYGDLFFYNLEKKDSECIVPYWSKTTLLKPFILHFDSIGEAARELKAIQRNWASYQFTQFRRAFLIQEKLPYINLKTKKFPFVIPQNPIGIYTLIDQNTLIGSAQTSSFLPAGNVTLEEDHENPPSRAYLKLQEALCRFTSHFQVPLPNENSRCFDAGACPGGWTWVLRQLDANVFAVDRTELVDSLMNDTSVEFLKHDAFTLKPKELGSFDWIFSDVICYPERLYEWVNMWLKSGLVKNMICTIKMQGEIDWKLVQKFADIPNSIVAHLNYNKHELTWMHCEE